MARSPSGKPMISADKPSSSLAVLVAVNLLPLAGVLVLGWQVADIVLVYWMENVVIGAFNVLRIAMASPDPAALPPTDGVKPTSGQLLALKLFLVPFFTVHYGIFCFGHGVFLVHLFVAGGGGDGDVEAAVLDLLSQPGIAVAMLAIAASHGFSFARNYVGKGEYRRSDPSVLMFTPYKRIVATHVFILAAAFLVEAVGSPAAALLLFVAIKTGLDGWMHLREHRQPAR